MFYERERRAISGTFIKLQGACAAEELSPAHQMMRLLCKTRFFYNNEQIRHIEEKVRGIKPGISKSIFIRQVGCND